MDVISNIAVFEPMLSEVHCAIKCTINGQVTIDNNNVKEEPTQYHKK